MTDPTIQRLRAERETEAQIWKLECELGELRRARREARSKAKLEEKLAQLDKVPVEVKVRQWDALWRIVYLLSAGYPYDPKNLAIVASHDPREVLHAWCSPHELQAWIDKRDKDLDEQDGTNETQNEN